MAVEFVGIDPNTDRDHCPTVWADADAQEILLQGWKPTPETQAECEGTSPANGSVPETEAIVRIPARMIPMIREACDAVERAQLR
ncbi:hypothetical protein DCW30_09290 [Streptomyces alfalfae]|uniref:Uncharacterized protein n=1 Tax=Streptomyces alfalfae TaxID=1642299 RepID=A0A1P8TJZ4_9ACTN|nr:hypothetical protein [Streptomyces alfalfae]AYA18333.1 hypothetical protein D3X13_20715 [Streptomyces fradiae]APY87958.1 hypothetical protein A7J05_21625 [Streptomyces alfalfae]QQC89645.1 hypothetical protein I8755_15355 [Streptomyces alfalfae]QUI32084.1 hypothetical protein H9W91_15335 [Streptomyces alfalfae]RXX45315.1 hypothetical protein DCW30_09290 [Streptomyces alfalfae]